MAAAHTVGPRESLSDLLLRLREGNRRFAEGGPRLADCGPQRRSTLACGGQGPAAAVLACSDSRVAPELIFDQGLGELFVVRVAGNVVDDIVLGSLEYAVEHLGVRLILVMGHSACEAVTSACSCQPEELEEAEGAAGALLRAIGPAVEAARSTCYFRGDLVDEGARLNVTSQAEALKSSRVITEALAEGWLTVLGAWYDVATGRVSWL